MFTQLARKILYLVLIISLLTACAGRPSTPSANVAPSTPSATSATSTPPTTGQTGFTTQFTYDPNGNLKTRTDANGATTEYEYDALTRLISRRYPDGSSVTYTYDSLGQRTSMTDSLGTTSYEYDIHGRPVKVTDPNGNTLQYAYDPRGLLTQMVYPDGSLAAYTWDANGQFVTVQDVSGTTRYEYDLGGMLTGRILPNDVNTHYEYDDANRLIAIRHTDSSGALLLGFEYDLDAAGNRTQVMQMRPDGNQVTQYEYDNLNRLVGVTNPTGEVITYQYDAIGNRNAMISSTAGETSYTYNGLGQLAELDGPQGQVTFRYDASGNLVERADLQLQQTTSYTWDIENRLAGLDNGTTMVSYDYGGDGSLVSMHSGGTTSYFLSDPLGSSGSILAEYADTGEIGATYLFGNTLIGERDSNGVDRFFLEDGFGSVRQTVDASGMIVDSGDLAGFSRPPGNTSIWGVVLPGVPGGLPGSEQYGLTQVLDVDTIELVRQEVVTGALRLIFEDLYAANGRQYGPLFEQAYRQQGNTIGNQVGFVLYGVLTPGMFLSDMWQLESNLRAQGRPAGSADYVEGVGRAGLRMIFGTVAGGIGFNLGLGPVGSVALSRSALELADLTAEGAAGLGRFYGSRMDRPYWWWSPMKWMPNDQYVTYLENQGTAGESRDITSDFIFFDYTGENTWDDFLNRYIPPPMCPPFCGDGGGGGAAVGGVSLDRAAEVLVNLNDITGATYDPRTGQVTLIGRQDLSLPPMNMDDLVVAIRAIYGSGENPGVTMVPVDPSMQDITQRVEYFSQTQNTHFGQVMFEADRYLKSLAAGTDTLTGQLVTPNVPGFKSELDLAFETHTGDVPWHRNWFVPGEIVIKQSDDGRSMIFDKATIILQSRFIEFLPDGSQQDVLGSSPVTDQFTSFMTEHYDEFAAEKPELAELVQLAKIVGFVRWLHDNNIPVDLSWVNDYQVASVDTPDTTPGIIAERSDGSYTVISMGGVDYSTDNTYTEDVGGNVDRLAEMAAASRPADYPTSWDLDYNGETLTAVAFNVAPAEIVGGYYTRVTDISIPLVGGENASFTRQYNSLDLGTGTLGSGWSQVIPALTFQTTPNPADPDSYYTQAVITTGTDRRSFTFGEDGFFHPDDLRASSEVLGVTSGDLFNPLSLPEGYYPHPGLPGQPLEVQDAQGRSLAYSGFALLKQDGSVMAFDSSGRLTGQRDAEGRRLNYTYNGEWLTAITDTAGHSLQFTYDSNGRLTDLTASNGQARHYTYDSSGNLIGVSDETGVQLAGYAYDANGRLNRITDQYGRVSEIAYDGLGRVISVQSSSGSSSAQYNTASNQVTYTNVAGNTVVRQYDDQNRLLSETDPWGNTIEYQYDVEDHITAFTDRNGNVTTFDYDERGNLTEAVSTLGDRTILWNYNEFGLPQASIDPANGITFYEYDERGRVTGVTSGLQVTELSSDGGIRYQEVDPLSVAYSYDVAGNLTTVQDAAGSVTHYTYDDLGNLATVQLPGGGEVRQTFDERSRLTSIADATGYQVAFGYNEQGQLANITTPAGQTQYQYTNGLVTAVTDPLNSTLQYGYDATGRLTSVTEPDASVTTYEYDVSGNLVTVKDALGRQTQFKYDAAGRVIEISYQQESGTASGGGASSGGDGSAGTPAVTSTNSSGLFLFLGVGSGVLVMGIVIVAAARRARVRRRKLESQDDWWKPPYPDDKDPLRP